MSDAKKCDVCGKYFEHNIPENYHIPFKIIHDLKITTYDGKGIWDKFFVDMCAECTEKFFGFIAGEVDIVKKEKDENVDEISEMMRYLSIRNDE